MTAAELELPADLVERVRVLSPDAKRRLWELVEPDPADSLTAWQAELQRRYEGTLDGSIKTYTLDEAMASLRESLRASREP